MCTRSCWQPWPRSSSSTAGATALGFATLSFPYPARTDPICCIMLLNEPLNFTSCFLIEPNQNTHENKREDGF